MFVGRSIPQPNDMPILRTKAFKDLDKIITVSRHIASLQLFDVIWHATFTWLDTVNQTARRYLQEAYFSNVRVEDIQRHLRLNCGSWSSEHIWWSGFWAGILGTYPASGSGSQTIESFHAAWQGKIQNRSKAEPLNIFAEMQRIFNTDWAGRFEWATPAAFRTWPETPALALFNSQSLRSSGRSCAVDFWNCRERRLCGGHNYYKMHVRTDSSKTEDPAGITTFHVMRALKQDGVAPAEAVIQKDVAETFCKLVTAEGSKLLDVAHASKLVTGVGNQMRLDVAVLTYLFETHCAVIEGHLSNTAWPRLKKLDGHVTRLCTCASFALHGDCEHVLFIRGLYNTDPQDPSAQLEKLPLVRPKGRKRKTLRDQPDAPNPKRAR